MKSLLLLLSLLAPMLAAYGKAPAPRVSLASALQGAQADGTVLLDRPYRGALRQAACNGIANVFCMQVIPTSTILDAVVFSTNPEGTRTVALISHGSGNHSANTPPLAPRVAFASKLPTIEHLSKLQHIEEFRGLPGEFQLERGSASWSGFALEADGTVRVITAQLFLHGRQVAGSLIYAGTFSPIR